MAEGYVPDPNSPAAMSIRLQQMQAQIDALKLRSELTNPSWTQTSTDILAIPVTPLPWTGDWQPLGMEVSIVVGTRRLLQVSAMCAFQKHGAKGAIELAIYMDGAATPSPANQVVRILDSVDGTTDDYHTMTIGQILSPSEGTHRFRVAAAPDSGTIDFYAKIGSVTRNFLIAQDIGSASA